MTELPPPELFSEIYRRHGHRCPMSTLGGRLGWAARRQLGGASRESLSAVFFHATCAVDGIAVATGCNVATGSLTVRDAGRHSLVLRDRERGRQVEVALQPAALAIAARYRRLDQALEGRDAGPSQDERRELEAERERVLQQVLEQLWSLPDERLLAFGES
jgi:formylmethanofuran dehydrogenase subunit E